MFKLVLRIHCILYKFSVLSSVFTGVNFALPCSGLDCYLAALSVQEGKNEREIVDDQLFRKRDFEQKIASDCSIESPVIN